MGNKPELFDCSYLRTKDNSFFIVKGYYHSPNKSFPKGFSDGDYARTNDNLFVISEGYYHPVGKVRAIPVFYEDEKGERFHKTLRKNFSKYQNSEVASNIAKVMQERPDYRHCTDFGSCLAVPVEDIEEVYDPRAFFSENKGSLRGTVWGKIIEALSSVAGISDSDIGIFGSYLLGFEITKDVDFLVYGKDNCLKLKKNFSKVLDFLDRDMISAEHNLKHVAKYSKILDGGFTDWGKIGERRWSSIQVAPGVLSTVRFVYKEGEIPDDPIASPLGKEVRIRGVVADDIHTNFVPRVWTIQNGAGTFRVVSYLWALQSCVRVGDEVEVLGSLHEDGLTISIRNFEHGVRILSE